MTASGNESERSRSLEGEGSKSGVVEKTWLSKSRVNGPTKTTQQRTILVSHKPLSVRPRERGLFSCPWNRDMHSAPLRNVSQSPGAMSIQVDRKSTRLNSSHSSISYA